MSVVGRADIFKGTPIAEATLLRWEEVSVNCSKYLITDIAQNSLGRFQFFFGW